MFDWQYAIRADEANHRDVNHTFAVMSADDTNPYLLKQMEDQKKPVKKADTVEPPTL